MPLDINLFRAGSGGNPDLIKESQRRRYASVELVDEIIAKDDKWRLMTGSIDNLRKDRNTVQKQVATKKKAGLIIRSLQSPTSYINMSYMQSALQRISLDLYSNLSPVFCFVPLLYVHISKYLCR